MSTVALEFVPPVREGGIQKAREEAEKVKELLEEFKIARHVNSLLIPGIIEEDPDRPVTLMKKMDPLETWKVIRDILPLECRITQVTSFHSENQLADRFKQLKTEDIRHVVCVGVPRTMKDGEGDGVSPMDALRKFKSEMPSRGVILIPTRLNERDRFQFKIDQGADFALSQMLYSDYIVKFLREMSQQTDARPQIMLSFGHVPQVELKKGLIRWLIKDDGNPLVEKEIAFVSRIAELNPEDKRKEMKDLYLRILDGIADLGFPVGIHLEAPYGFSKPAFRLFSELLNTWSPASQRKQD